MENTKKEGIIKMSEWIKCKNCGCYITVEVSKEQNELCTTCYVKDLNKRLGTGDNKNGNKN